MLPFGYAIRNLFRDPKRLFQAVLGSGLVVFMVMVAAALNSGMAGALAASGSSDNVILLGAGSEDTVLRRTAHWRRGQSARRGQGACPGGRNTGCHP